MEHLLTRNLQDEEILEDHMKIDLTRNNIVRGDNIDWLNWIPDESVDLCYIDPPYFSGKDQDIVWKNGAELRSFGDKFRGDVRYYMEWLTPRLELIHKKLKKTGSIFVQCDWHASHRIRCALDDIFGANNFINEIIWQRTFTTGSSKSKSKGFAKNTDSIFFYSKTDNYCFHPKIKGYADATLKRYDKTDENGQRFKWENLKSYSQEKLAKLMEKGEAKLQKNSKYPVYKSYLKEDKGTPIDNLWNDLEFLGTLSPERIGYPTQKPEALIKRIIECASNPGDIVLDCFVGGGTTAKVCADLNRRFLVGDVSPVAVRMTATRLQKAGYIGIEIKNLAKTKEQLLAMRGQDFEKFVAEARGWEHNGRDGGGDGNIDAIAPGSVPVQIKNHRTPTGPSDIKEFFGTLVANKKNKGFFVAWEYSKQARVQVAKFKQDHGVEIVLMTCSEALETLILDPTHHQLYEKIFNELAPESWKTPTIQNSIEDAS